MWVLLPVGAFAVAILLHGLVVRLALRVDSVRRFLLVGFPIGIFVVASAFALFGMTIRGFAAIFLYAFLCELYMFVFTLVLSSVSATMLIMLRRRSVKASAFTSAYDPREMVFLRLERLLRNGFVERVDGRLAVTSKGMTVHKAFKRLQQFLGHTPT